MGDFGKGPRAGFETFMVIVKACLRVYGKLKIARQLAWNVPNAD
jgi:hypothetical protein